MRQKQHRGDVKKPGWAVLGLCAVPMAPGCSWDVIITNEAGNGEQQRRICMNCI